MAEVYRWYMKAIKKAIPVEVWQLNHKTSYINLPQFVVDHFTEIELCDDGTWKIQTPEGVMSAMDGDYLIQGVAGEIYPCKREIFLKTYIFVNDGARS